MGKCTRRNKYTAEISKNESPNSEPGLSEEIAVLPPGGTRDHVQCEGPNGLAGLEGWKDLGRCLTPTYTRRTPDHPPLTTRPNFSAQVILSLGSSLIVTSEKPSVLPRGIDWGLGKTPMQVGKGCTFSLRGLQKEPPRTATPRTGHIYTCQRFRRVLGHAICQTR